MAIVNRTKSSVERVDTLYYDKAWMKVWAFGTLISYPRTPRNWSGWTTSYNSTRTASQPTSWNYRDLIRRHLNATTNLVGTKYVVEQSKGSYLYLNYEAVDPADGVTWRPMYWYLDGTVIGLHNPPPAITIPLTDADRDARIKFLKSCRKSYQSFQGLTFLGELRETVHMLKHPFQNLTRGLGDYLRRVKKRGNRTPKRALQDMITGSWLESQYGWLPFLSDIDSAGKALEDHLNRYSDDYDRVFGKGESETAQTTAYTAWNVQNGPWTLYFEERVKQKARAKYYGQTFRSASLSEGWTSKELGLSFNDFLPTVWELIPYSFLADYVSNVGDVVDAFSANTSGVKWCSRGWIRESIITTSYTGYSRNTAYQPDAKTRKVVMNASATPSVVTLRSIDRAWLQNPPIVGLADFSWDGLGLGTRRWLNIAALGAQSLATSRFLARRP